MISCDIVKDGTKGSVGTVFPGCFLQGAADVHQRVVALCAVVVFSLFCECVIVLDYSGCPSAVFIGTLKVQRAVSVVGNFVLPTQGALVDSCSTVDVTPYNRVVGRHLYQRAQVGYVTIHSTTALCVSPGPRVTTITL